MGAFRLLERPVVCLITDRRLPVAMPLEDAVERAVEGGVTMVQVREKDLPTRDLLQLVLRLRSRVEGRALIMVNGRTDIAYASQADGVHLPADGLPIAGARAVLGPHGLIGRSVHEVAQAAACEAAGADYVELGTVFPSRSHPGGPTIGLDAVAQASAGRIPVIGVGGITAASAAAVIQAGASGVAMISAILADADPRAASMRIRNAALEGWAKRGAGHGATEGAA